MEDLITSGRIADLILGLIVLEALAFVAIRRISGNGPRLLSLLGTLASGVFLLLAFRSAASGQPWTVTAGCLAGAFIAHAADIAGRWRT